MAHTWLVALGITMALGITVWPEVSADELSSFGAGLAQVGLSTAPFEVSC